MEQKLETYREVEAYILDIPKFTKKNGWEETDAFYGFLGRPGERQNIIHVAGTNGKGSVCAYSEAMIMATGHTCGLFSSPHLVCMRERIRVQRNDIPEEAFVRIFSDIMEQCRAFREEYGKKDYFPTFFELLFFIAMRWFEETRPEYIILETGLGGRLDATNVVREKKICIITKIAYDHMEYLGDTLEKITAEKAGIITGKAPVYYYHTETILSDVIRKKAEERNAETYPLYESDIQNIKNHQNFIDFSISFEYDGEYNIRVATCALYQCMNASLALYAMRGLLKEELTPEAAADAIVRTSWPCRMEEVLPGIILDGAHNPDGIRALMDSLSCRQGSKVLLFAVVKDKEIDAMVDCITAADLFEEYIITVAGGDRAAGLHELEQRFQKGIERSHQMLRRIVAVDDPGEAFAYGRKICKDRLLVVAGSLYLTGMIYGMLKG